MNNDIIGKASAYLLFHKVPFEVRNGMFIIDGNEFDPEHIIDPDCIVLTEQEADQMKKIFQTDNLAYYISGEQKEHIIQIENKKYYLYYTL